MADITNGNVNIYEPRSMAGSFDKRMPVTTFLRDTFFPTVKTFMTEKVDVDFRKGGYLIAPFVAPNVGGINMERKGYETRTYTPPRIAPQRTISPEVLTPRIPGETLHTSMSPEERQDYYLQQDAQELDDAISRREEVMCAQLLTNGIINVRGYIDDNLEKYIDDNIDFQFSNKVTLTSTDAWSDPNSTKYEDLETGVETILKAGYNPDICVLGKDAWGYLRSDENFLKLLDNRRLEIGLLRPDLRTVDGNGLKYIGDLPDLGLSLYVYYAWYKDYDGTIKPVFPTDHVLIAPEGLGEMLYGAITQLEEDKRYHTYEGTRVPKIIANMNDDVMTFRLSSRPLPKPFDVDAWYVMDVVG